MNHKATAPCKNGHAVVWGSCTAQVKRLFGGSKECRSKGFEQLYGNGRTATISFDDEPWTAVRCVGCKTVFTSTRCPTCGEEIPVSAFRKAGVVANLG